VSLAELHQVLFRHAHAAPLGHGFVSRRCGLAWLLDATRLQRLAAAALKNWIGDAVEQIPSQ